MLLAAVKKTTDKLLFGNMETVHDIDKNAFSGLLGREPHFQEVEERIGGEAIETMHTVGVTWGQRRTFFFCW